MVAKKLTDWYAGLTQPLVQSLDLREKRLRTKAQGEWQTKRLQSLQRKRQVALSSNFLILNPLY